MTHKHSRRFFPRETWSYALLLVVLFAIAAIAVHRTIDTFGQMIPATDASVFAAVIIALTLGFMSISGAFGLWAIKFSAGAESRRRIGRLVDAMDYLSDGLLALDHRGHVRGSNPAIAGMTKASEGQHDTLTTLFPCISDDDAALLLNAREPQEVERRMTVDGSVRTIRFRSQPSEGIILILVSDVTTEEVQKQRNRQIARLQLIGELARGVAHDFNNLLCSISGHAALLPRLGPRSQEMQQSLEAISRDSDRGVALAAHLLELARPAISILPTLAVGEHLHSAARILRDTLPEGWEIDVTSGALPPIALTGMQIEQIVTNIGLVAADALGSPGKISITAGPPGANTLFDVGARYAGVILIEAAQPAREPASRTYKPDDRETGVIQSVIRSLLDEAGGGLDRLAAADGAPIFRVRLPRGSDAASGGWNETDLPFDLGAYVRGWTVILAAGPAQQVSLDRLLRQQQVRVERADSIATALARLEETPDANSMLIEQRLLGAEEKGLLRAILKLRPSLGVCVLTVGQRPAGDASTDVVFVAANEHPNTIIRSMIEARALAARRGR